MTILDNHSCAEVEKLERELHRMEVIARAKTVDYDNHEAVRQACQLAVAEVDAALAESDARLHRATEVLDQWAHTLVLDKDDCIRLWKAMNEALMSTAERAEANVRERDHFENEYDRLKVRMGRASRALSKHFGPGDQTAVDHAMAILMGEE